MARNIGRRQQNRPAADWNHFYVYGSAVRQPEALPSGNGTVRKPKKKSLRDIMQQNTAINEMRKKKYNTRG